MQRSRRTVEALTGRPRAPPIMPQLGVLERCAAAPARSMASCALGLESWGAEEEALFFHADQVGRAFILHRLIGPAGVIKLGAAHCRRRRRSSSTQTRWGVRWIGEGLRTHTHKP